MPKTFTCPFTQNINPQVPQTFTNADGNTVKTIFTAGADDSRIYAILISSTDTSDRTLQLYLSDGTTSFELRRLTISASAGTSVTVPIVSGLSGLDLPFDSQGNRYMPIRRNFQLRANVIGTAVTSSQTIAVIVLAEDF
jgi:hypothetical protein